MNEDEIRELFREMRDEPVPPDSLVRVRQAVTERRRRGWSSAGWKVATGVLATACLVLVALLFRPRVPAPMPPAPIIAIQPQVAVETPVTAVKKSPRKVAKPPKKAAPAPAALIRIENSDDPDVVILLVN
jgi:hypothetical protein